jgi:uncharacterized ion transporter superfamily protein YfcC
VIPWEDIGIPFPTWWWWFPEMTASFLLFAIIIGLIGRMGEGALTTSFVDGARDLLGVALIIGIAPRHHRDHEQRPDHRHDPALGREGPGGHGRGRVPARDVPALPAPVSRDPSTSGLATLSMPIMAPLAGFVGVSTALVVTAYQSASGVMNLVVPTSAVVMGGLAIARVPYGTYLRWVWPLLVLLSGLVVVVLAISAAL